MSGVGPTTTTRRAFDTARHARANNVTPPTANADLSAPPKR
jgi:hypothetical protein